MFSRLFNLKSSKNKPAQPLPDDMRLWSPQNVCDWLEKNDLKDFSDAFVNNAISGGELAFLTEQDLETLGVKAPSVRKTLLQLIANWSRKLEYNWEEQMDDNLSSTPTRMSFRLNQQYALFEEVLDGIIVINVDKTILYVNKTVEHCFSYDRADLIGCNINILMPEPYRSQHDAYIDSYLNNYKTARVIGKGRMVEAKAKDHSLLPIWFSVTEAIDDDGNRIFIGSCKDLRAIQPSQETMLDNLVDAAIVINVESTIVFFNKAAEQMFGFSKEETIGNSVEILTRRVEIWKKDGTKQSVLFALSETKWGEEQTIAFCATLQSITELVVDLNTSSQVIHVEHDKLVDSHDIGTRQLHEVFDSPTGRMAFKQFLEQSKTLEPLMFIEAVDAFNVLKSQWYRCKQAMVIFETYITHKAPKEINLPASIRQELITHFENKASIAHCPCNIFLKAYEAILFDIKNDCFTRFKTTPAFKTLKDVFSK